MEGLESNIITDIKAQVRTPGRKSIFINGEFRFGVSEETLLAFNLACGQQLSSKQIEIIQTHEEYENTRRKALHFLTIRMRSIKELSIYLHRHVDSDFTIQRVIEYCIEHNYVNDLDFAKAFTRDKLILNRYGMLKIKSVLRQKGVSQQIIDSILSDLIDDEDQVKLAKELAVKKLKSVHDTQNLRAKMYRYLAQRGFRGDVIAQALKGLIE